MDTRLSDIQRELVDSVVVALDRHAKPETIDEVIASEDGFDRTLYGLFVELGWTFLGWETDEDATLVELGLVVEELGAYGVPTPYRAVMSAAYLAAAASKGVAEVLGAISEEGEIVVVVDRSRTARPLVEWAGVASALLVIEPAGESGASGASVRLVPAADADIQPVDVFDSERTAAVTVPAGVGEELGVLETSDLDRWRAVDRLLRACDILGASRRSLAMTVENAKSRNQFGRPIGSFQALQHQAADMRMAIEATSVLTRSALWRASTGHPFVRQALYAAWQASETGQFVSTTAVQLHGGIGFIKEYPLHHFYRRTKAQRLRMGAPRQLVRELGDAVLADAAGGAFRERFVDWPESGR